jgi:hypothetical protein
LVLPIDPGAGLAFGLAALAIGHYPAVRDRLPVQRWRFTGGRLPFGIVQIAAGAVAALAESEHGPVILLPVLLLYVLSVWLGGRWIANSYR